MNFHSSKIAAALLVVAAALVAGGCIWGQRSGLGILAGARNAGMDAETVSFTLETTFDGMEDEALLDGMSFKAHGSTDSSNDRGFMVFEIAGSEMEIRYLEGKSYIRFIGDTWVESEEDDEDFLDVFSSFDPFDILEELGADDSDVKRIGSGEVHGKKVEKFAISIEADALEDSSLSDLMPPNTPVELEIWIDSDGRPAHLGYNFAIAPGSDLGLDNTETVRFSITLELFDYGKPVNVEAPPADKIGKTPSLGSLGGLGGGDPFAGADCYGDKLDRCLAPNPEVDAMAQNPKFCQGFDVRVCLVPMGFVRADVIRAIVDFHKTTANIDVVVLPSIPLAANLLDRENSQLATKALDELMKSTYITTGTASTFIGISAIDQQGESYGWWFGHRFGRSGFSNQHGMFSYFRMANVPPYNGEPITDDLTHLRASKYAARYTALLLLDFPTTEDDDYLNYYEMYGFSDLDSMGTKWPEGSPPCLGLGVFVCVIPDNQYTDEAFEDDVLAAAERVMRETGVSVQVRGDKLAGGYEPSKPDWGAEYISDLSSVLRKPYHYSRFPIVGVTDDSLAQDASVTARIDEPHPLLNMSVVSGYGAGKPGSAEHRERIYRLVLRGVLVAQFGMELSDDPESLMYAGATTPADLDGKTIPPIPKR